MMNDLAKYVWPVIALVAVIALLFTLSQGSANVTPTPTPLPNATATPQTAVHTVDEAKNYLGRVMASYSDMLYAQVPTPKFDPASGKWEAIVEIYKSNVSQRVLVRLSDNPALLLDKVYVEGPIPSAISDNWVVTNGTVQISGKLACSPDAGGGNKTCVWEFADPYDLHSALVEDSMNAFVEKHGESINFTYRVVLTQSLNLEVSYQKEDVERISKYFICSQDQGLLVPLKACATTKYRAKGVDAPLSATELDACLPEGLDMEMFNSCVANASSRIAADLSIAQTYLGVNSVSTPNVVFGCMYRVHPTYLEYGFCAMTPDAQCN